MSFEGPQDAFDVLDAAHFTLLDHCCVLTADWLCASLAGSESPDTALRCLHAAGQALEHGSGVASLLKVAALKVLLPLGSQLEEADGAAVFAALESCTPQECTALNLALVVDARDDTPLAARWSPQFGDVKLVSPRQASGSDETLAVLNLRATDVHVNWVDFEGGETHYSMLNLKSHVRGSPAGAARARGASPRGHLTPRACASADPLWWHADLAVLRRTPVARLRRLR